MAEEIIGAVRVIGDLSQKKHAADGMTAQVCLGDGAYSTIINPQSFLDGGPEWVMRYGNVDSIRYSVASILGSYDYLLSGNIPLYEAIRRLLLLRAARKTLSTTSKEVG